MKNFFLKSIKYFITSIIVVLLATASIDAVDHRDDISESLIGRIILGESNSKCPSDMVFVQASWGDFCIDKYEVSASTNCPFSNPTNLSESTANIDNPNCHAISKEENIPWANISQNQAYYACVKEGKRLPSNKEWSVAALGTPDLDNGWGENDCQVSENWLNQPGFTGSGKNCYSFSGAYDMVGNVWEWVDGSVEEGEFAYRELPEAGYVNGINPDDAFPSETSNTPDEMYKNDYVWIKNTKTRTIARGGYYNNKEEAGQYTHYIVSTPTETSNATGFRCVKNPN